MTRATMRSCWPSELVGNGVVQVVPAVAAMAVFSNSEAAMECAITVE